MPAQQAVGRCCGTSSLSGAAGGAYFSGQLPFLKSGRTAAHHPTNSAYPAAMASNLDYLNPALIPLEEKVNDYLEAEKSIRRAETNAAQTAHKTRDDLARMEQEIIALLPTRNEWVKVNLGYGPSRVGAWHVPASTSAPERYELRIVH